jgi:hypothetical protein
MRRPALLLALVLALAVPLAGCLDDGGEDVETSSNPAPTDEAPSVGNPSQVYSPGAVGNATADAALPGDAPAPRGLGLPMGIEKGYTFEPTIGVTSGGDLFVSRYAGDFGTDWISVVRSQDGGRSWEDVTGNVGPVSSPPQSNDPYVYVDESTDRVYNLDMQGLQCNWVRWSDDAGESWTANPLGCGQPPLLDHPTLFAGNPTELQTEGYENVLYLCVNRVADSACATSLDGGLTWSPFRTVFKGAEAKGTPDAEEPFQSTFENFCGGLHAHGVAAPDGTAYLPKGQCGTPKVAYTEDNGLNWGVSTISEEVDVHGHEVALAVDDQGNLFAHWIGQDLRPYLASSTDGGETWTDPVDVAPPNVTLADKPTIAAGSDGSVALAYVGTTADADTYDDVPDGEPWHAYITTSVDATQEDPVVATTRANPADDPIARGQCGGERCYGTDGGGLGDFIDVTVDDEGRPWAAFVDVCTSQCVDDPEAGNQESVGLVGTLARGPSLEGPPDPLPPLGVEAT